MLTHIWITTTIWSLAIRARLGAIRSVYVVLASLLKCRCDNVYHAGDEERYQNANHGTKSTVKNSMKQSRLLDPKKKPPSGIGRSPVCRFHAGSHSCRYSVPCRRRRRLRMLWSSLLVCLLAYCVNSEWIVSFCCGGLFPPAPHYAKISMFSTPSLLLWSSSLLFLSIITQKMVTSRW
jgi:hypothetical protein